MSLKLKYRNHYENKNQHPLEQQPEKSLKTGFLISKNLEDHFLNNIFIRQLFSEIAERN